MTKKGDYVERGEGDKTKRITIATRSTLSPPALTLLPFSAILFHSSLLRRRRRFVAYLRASFGQFYSPSVFLQIGVAPSFYAAAPSAPRLLCIYFPGSCYCFSCTASDAVFLLAYLPVAIRPHFLALLRSRRASKWRKKRRDAINRPLKPCARRSNEGFR